MSFAILRVAKLKNINSISSSLKHVYRERETPNADPNIRNMHFVGATKKQAMASYRDRIGSLAKPPRSNAVLMVNYVLTASSAFFNEEPKPSVKEWAKANYDFLCEKHGKENIVSFVLHLDETTPHIHAYVVPIHEGRLNCRHFLGEREKLSQLQDEYAENMDKFGLKRGLKGSIAKHQSIKKWYSQLPSVMKNVQARERAISKGEASLKKQRKLWAEKEEELTEKVKEAKALGNKIGTIFDGFLGVSDSKVHEAEEKIKIEAEKQIKEAQEKLDILAKKRTSEANHFKEKISEAENNASFWKFKYEGVSETLKKITPSTNQPKNESPSSPKNPRS